ncbi:MAG TPA: sigma-54 dependent transcriptional regulator [Desulfuromonadales bacterium]|nr:sigma-54 dependent transcriptional regulator [Desulfuromonadales bacterium]
MTMANILIIDDDDDMRSTLSLMVERKGHRAMSAATLGEGIAKASKQQFEVVFLDVRMPDGSGLDILPRLGEKFAPPEVIIITGFGDSQGAELAIKSGAWDYIEKGSSIQEITFSLEKALQYRQEKEAARSARTVLTLKREGIIGDSPKLRACLDLVSQAAGTDGNVLITGETGTGKELFARAIHSNSLREKNDFVVVDCAALPETLVEGLLFGHEKGTFTGAEKDREGLVGQAHGGTLFLDEVGELPMSLQKAFLRVLQERRFRPLGGSREIESDFRLVAATNRNLDQMVQNGLFRADLLFRLHSFSIELPPLREWPEDIRILAKTILENSCERYGLAPKRISPEFLETLMAYHWPGNVRELANTMEHCLTAARLETTLFPKHLPTQIRARVVKDSLHHADSRTETGTSNRLSSWSLPKLQDYRDSIYAQAEKQYMMNLMSLAQEDIGEACLLSGLSQSRLYALLKKHEIPRSR